MSIDERAASTAGRARPERRTRAVWWRRPWVVPLGLVAVGFLIYALPPYLGLDPARARLQPMPDSPLFYPLLVTHIFLGSMAILTACFQVWPWLRRTHPAIHRHTGRVYVAAVLTASLCVAMLAPMTTHGLNSQVANTTLAVLWFVTTAAGFRAAQQRRFAEHRVWMLRSFALTFSIIANRVWMMLVFTLYVPEVFSGVDVDEAKLFQAVGVASWTSWIVNLLVVEWWIHRPGRRPARRPTPAATRREPNVHPVRIPEDEDVMLRP